MGAMVFRISFSKEKAFQKKMYKISFSKEKAFQKKKMYWYL
jgi:hypothetical protein